jgi:hypothetical protein
VPHSLSTTFYRFVNGEIPTANDFKSQGALGKKMRFAGDQRAWDFGISVYDAFDAACAVAVEIRYGPGSYLAMLSLPSDHGLEVVQTGRNQHHYTIYADAEVLLRL